MDNETKVLAKIIRKLIDNNEGIFAEQYDLDRLDMIEKGIKTNLE